MFRSLFNLVIILIPLAIFVGRVVVQARSRHSPPPKIPVHFEDDEDEDNYEGPKASQEYVKALPDTRNKLSSKPGKKTTPPMASVNRGAVESSPASKAGKATPGMTVPVPAVHGGKSFPQNLAHLPPLKQAVVMAEVLGPPKALQE